MIPNPLHISCTDCHQPMRIEFQSSMHALQVVVAAECNCGRFIGIVNHIALRKQSLGVAPITRHDLDCHRDPGKESADLIREAREAIAEAERVIAAATWANQGKVKP